MRDVLRGSGAGDAQLVRPAPPRRRPQTLEAGVGLAQDLARLAARPCETGGVPSRCSL
jgi:hypothetical protein